MSVKLLKDDLLEKHFRVIVSSKNLETTIADELRSIAPTVKMQGFRPGKVPVSFIQKKHGAAIRSDAINTEINRLLMRILVFLNLTLCLFLLKILLGS